MSELPHASTLPEGEAVILPFNPRVPESETEITQMSDADCVAFLVDYTRHPSVTPDRMYGELYRLLYPTEESAWKEKIDHIRDGDYFDLHDEYTDDPIIQDIFERLRDSKSKSPDEDGVREARKVLNTLVDLRCVSLRDNVDAKWSQLLEKLPAL